MIHDVKYGQGLSFDYAWIDSMPTDEASYNVDTVASDKVLESNMLADKHPRFRKVSVNTDTTITVTGTMASLHVVADNCTVTIVHDNDHASLRLHVDVTGTVNIIVKQNGARCIQYKTVDCHGDVNVYDCLEQEWAQCYNDVHLYTGKSVQRTSTVGGYANVYTRVFHHASGTESVMSSKSVSRDTVYRGLIHIPNGVSAVSHQECDIVLLDNAKAVALPILDVTSEDVECSHGASISTFDEGVVRYLSSRGVSKSDQETLLVESIRAWGQP